MARSGTITVKILGDAAPLQRTLGQVSGQVEGFGSKMGKVAGLVGGAFAAAGVASALKGTISAAMESNKVAAQTQAVLKSTGGAAGLTAAQIGDLSTAISNKTGIDDEAIQSGENLLLTFTNLRNGVGKGNDIFSQATSIMADMSVALGQDTKSSAIQLGKALNDPIKGVTALQRVGVSFTEDQKKQIKALVDSGKTMEAQKLILGELRKEFGGSAEAAATPWAKLQVTLGNVQETIGNALLPVFNSVVEWLAKRLPGAIATASKWFNNIKVDLAPVIATVKAFLYTLTSGFTEDEGTPVENFALMLREKVLPVIKQIAEFVVRNWKPILLGLVAVFIAVTSPISAVVAGLVLLYVKFKVVRDAARFLIDEFRDLQAWVKKVWPDIQEVITHVINVIQGAWELFGDELISIARVAWDQVRAVIKTAVDLIRGVIQFVMALINGDWGKAWDALKGIVGDVLGLVKDTVGNALKLIREVIEAGLDLLRIGWDKAWNGLSSVVGGVFDFIKGAAISAYNFIVRNFIKPFTDSINKVIDALNSIPDPLDLLPKLPTLPSVNEIPIPGPGSPTGGARPGDELIGGGTGAGSVNAGPANKLQGVTINVYNPTGEPTEESAGRELRRATYLLGVA